MISKFLYISVDKKEAPSPPAAAAKQVVTSTKEVFAGSADKTDPPLNPNHPSHNIRTPAADSGMLEPGIATAFPELSNYPFLAPSK